MADEKSEGKAPEQETLEQSEFDSLLKQEFKPKSDRAQEAVTEAVQTLAEQAITASTLISDDAIETIEAMVAELDRKLTEQINLIIHHADFMSFEPFKASTLRV